MHGERRQENGRDAKLVTVLVEERNVGRASLEWAAGGFDRFGQGLDNNVLDMNRGRGPSSSIDAAVEEIYASIRAARLGGLGWSNVSEI